MTRWRLATVLVAMLLAASCDGAASQPATTSTSAMPAPTTTTSTITTSTTTTTTTIPPTTTVPGSTLPGVAVGWEALPGDVLVAGLDSIQIVRGGEVVAHPVTVPVQTAVGDGDGGIVALPSASAEDIDPFGRGADVLWRLRGDGTAEVVYEAPGAIDLFEPFRDDASTTWLLFAEERPVDEWMIDHLMAMPLRLGDPVTLAVGGSWEGGYSGAVWIDGAVVSAFDAEGMSWIESVGLDDGVVELEHNPVPFPEGRYVGGSAPPDVRLLATVPYGHRIATVTQPGGAVIDPKPSLVVVDLATGDEAARRELPDDPAVIYTRLSADDGHILISRAGPSAVSRSRASLPVLEYDLVTGALSELAFTGTAVIVGGA